MNPGLRYLLAKGPSVLVRQVRRRFRGRRGALLFAALLFLLTLLIGPQVLRYSQPRDPDQMRLTGEYLRQFAPLALLLLVCLTGMRGGLYFKPAEIQFLFPAPIGRRELLVYNALAKMRVQLFSGLWISIFVLAYTNLWYAAIVASVLFLAFLQLSAQALGLLLLAADERFGKRNRWLALLGILALGAAGIAVAMKQVSAGAGWLAGLEAFAQLPPVQTLSWITRPLVEVYLAASFVEFLIWATVSIGILAALLGLMVVFDVAYSEGAIERAQTVQRALQRMRSGGGAFAAGGGKRTRWHVPRLPFLRGAGPIAWRQLQEMTRNYRGTLMIGLFMLLWLVPFLVLPFLIPSEIDKRPLPVTLPLVMVLVMTPMMTMNLAFDFRRDLDRMPVLKSLPVSGLALSAGQIVPTALLLCFWELVGVIIVAIVTERVPAEIVAGIVLGLLPLNMALVAIDNILFLWMPYRLVVKDPGRMPFMGRLMIVMFLKMLLLGVLAAVGAIPAYAVWTLSGGSALATSLAVAAFLAICCVPLTYGVAAAFRGFDVSQDVPE